MPHNKILAAAFGSSGVFIACVDSTALSVALPTIAHDLQTDLQVVQWVALVTIIIIGPLLLGSGRLADLIGRKKVFLSGVGIFALGALVSAISPNLPILISGRAISGIGLASLYSVGPALVIGAFSAKSRGRALGIVGTVTSIGLVTGLILSGLIINEFGWHVIFVVDILVAGLIIVSGLIFLSETDRIQGEGFDLPGSVLMIAWMVPLLFAITQGNAMGWASPVTLGLLATGIVLLTLFVYLQRRSRFPTIDFTLLQIPSFRAPMGASFCGFIAVQAVIFLTPFYLQNALQLPVQQVGLIIAIFGGMMMFLAPIAGWIADRIGSKIPSTFGLALLGMGLFILGTLDSNTSVTQVVIALAIAGAGLGCFEWTLNSAIVGSLPRSKLGVASGFLATARTLGFSTGQAVWATLFAVVVTINAGTNNALQSPLGSLELGFRVAFLAAAGVAMFAALLASKQGQVNTLDEKPIVILQHALPDPDGKNQQNRPK